MIPERPFFMSNPSWYYFDEEEWCYKLTGKATDKAKESYDEYYASVKWGKE